MSKKIRSSPAKSKDTPDFEKSLSELEQIVARMEQGELSLDQSLQQFERGIALARSCQNALQVAEQKVEILLKKSAASAQAEVEPFLIDASNDTDE